MGGGSDAGTGSGSGSSDSEDSDDDEDSAAEDDDDDDRAVAGKEDLGEEDEEDEEGVSGTPPARARALHALAWGTWAGGRLLRDAAPALRRAGQLRLLVERLARRLADASVASEPGLPAALGPAAWAACGASLVAGLGDSREGEGDLQQEALKVVLGRVPGRGGAFWGCWAARPARAACAAAGAGQGGLLGACHAAWWCALATTGR